MMVFLIGFHFNTTPHHTISNVFERFQSSNTIGPFYYYTVKCFEKFMMKLIFGVSIGLTLGFADDFRWLAIGANPCNSFSFEFSFYDFLS